MGVLVEGSERERERVVFGSGPMSGEGGEKRIGEKRTWNVGG